MIIKDQIINKTGIPLYKDLLRITSSTQKLTSANIANVSTPGFQAKSVDFKKEMQAALKKKKINLEVTNPRHIPPVGKPKSIKIITDTENSNASGVNNVDIDKEMAQLAENQILYSYGSRMMAKQFNTLRGVIRGRR
jgi:flagellar basal-body rod protein FlgB